MGGEWPIQAPAMSGTVFFWLGAAKDGSEVAVIRSPTRVMIHVRIIVSPFLTSNQ